MLKKKNFLLISPCIIFLFILFTIAVNYISNISTDDVVITNMNVPVSCRAIDNGSNEALDKAIALANSIDPNKFKNVFRQKGIPSNEILDYVSEYQNAQAALDELLSYDKLIIITSPKNSTSTRDLESLRNISWIRITRAWKNISEKRFEDGINDFVSVLKFSNILELSCGEFQIVISGITEKILFINEISETIELDLIPKKMLPILRKKISKYIALEPWLISFITTRCLFLEKITINGIKSKYTKNKPGKKELLITKNTSSVIRQHCANAILNSNLPVHKRGKLYGLKSYFRKNNLPFFYKDILWDEIKWLDGSMLDFSHYFLNYDLNETRLRLLVLIIALKEFQYLNKSLPSSLENLVPKYIDSLPVDPYSGQNFLYSKQKRMIWSKGNKKSTNWAPKHKRERESLKFTFD